MCGSIYTSSQNKTTYVKAGHFALAGARGIEPRSKVLETFILAVILCPFDVMYVTPLLHYG